MKHQGSTVAMKYSIVTVSDSDDATIYGCGLLLWTTRYATLPPRTKKNLGHYSLKYTVLRVSESPL